MLSVFVRQTLRPFVTSENGDDLDVLKELVEAGRLSPVVDRVYPLREPATILARFGNGTLGTRSSSPCERGRPVGGAVGHPVAGSLHVGGDRLPGRVVDRHVGEGGIGFG